QMSDRIARFRNRRARMLHMYRKGCGFQFAVAVGFAYFLSQALPAQGQLWSNVLTPSRATDWTQTGVTGGIPNRTNICQTIPPFGSLVSPASAATINSAIRACSSAGGGVVLLQAGTYYLNDAIVATPVGQAATKNVTLRGAGPDQTTIYFTGSPFCATGGFMCMG